MRRILLVVTVAVLVSIAGCSGFGGGGETEDPSPDGEEPLESSDENRTTESGENGTDEISWNVTIESGNNETTASGGNRTVVADNTSTTATDTNYTVLIAANESLAGSELESLSVTYPRENFTVDSAQHEEILLGVDTDGDDVADRTFNETHVSGINTNDYSFTIELDAEYALEADDVIGVMYPAVDNPAEPGEYEVEVTLNEAQTATVPVTITADDSG